MPDPLNIADNVARLVLDTYNSLPKAGKPAVRSNGIAEWTVLAGLVAQHADGIEFFHKSYIDIDSGLHCLSVATGVKCLPQNKVAEACGLALHDSHAEILAIRGFNRFTS
jgi:tRNA-specific adenosine deaminase 1